jgi:hypothetical protein
MVEIRNAYKVLASKPDEKEPHVRPRYRWEYNNKMLAFEAFTTINIPITTQHCLTNRKTTS